MMARLGNAIYLTAVAVALLASAMPTSAGDIAGAWKCDDAFVELHREGVHMFTLHLNFDTETRDAKTGLPSPLYFNHDHNGEPIGTFNLRFDKKGAILNGKRCRIACIAGKECE